MIMKIASIPTCSSLIMKTASIPTCLSLSDSNECTRNNGGCSIDADCINLPGSYKCVCEEGFKGDGYTCGGKFLSVVGKWRLNLYGKFLSVVAW